MSEILHGEKYFFAGFAAAELEKIAMNLKKQRLVEKAPDARNSEACAVRRTETVRKQANVVVIAQLLAL